MSTISELESQLSSYQQEKQELNVKLDTINSLKSEYSSIMPNIFSIRSLTDNFISSIAEHINGSLMSNNSGSKVTVISNVVTNSFLENDYSSPISQLMSDVSAAYTELIKKENEINTRINTLDNLIISIIQQIEDLNNSTG